MLLSFAAVLISSLLVVSGGVVRGWHWYSDRVAWRDAEYRKLRSLASGYSLQQFNATLGSPLFVRRSANRKLVESTFRGRDYWVQTVSDLDGTVVLYAVTSCDLRFRPTFRIDTVPVTLNRSTFETVTRGIGVPADADYYISGATANTFFVESFNGGNPTGYKTYAWGIDDACPQAFSDTDRNRQLLYQHHQRFRRTTGSAPPLIRRFRHLAIVNTFAEVAPAGDIAVLRKAFQIGVDRQLTRSAPGP